MLIRIKRILFLATFFQILSISNLLSQDINCECDPAVPWDPPYPAYKSLQNISVFNGSAVTVNFREQICNGVSVMQIVSIEDVGLVNNYDPDEIFVEVMRTLIINNQMRFPPFDTTEYNVWKFCHQACWRYENSNKESLIPCDDYDNLCVTEIYVYLAEECNKFSYEVVRQVTMPEECFDESNEHDPLRCYKVCYPFINPKGQ